MEETKVIEYKGSKAMKSGIKKMAVNGWMLKETTPVRHNPSCLLTILCIFTFGIFALFLRSKDTYVCTFTRPLPLSTTIHLRPSGV